MTLESWAARLGYVVEEHSSLFFVHRENEAAVSLPTRDQVVDFILEKIRRDCCEDK